MKCVVATTCLDAKQRHALGTAQLVVLPDDFAHLGNPREALLVVCFITHKAILVNYVISRFTIFAIPATGAGRVDLRYLKLLRFHDRLVALATCGQGR